MPARLTARAAWPTRGLARFCVGLELTAAHTMSAPCHLLKPTAGPPASWSASSGFTECVRSENGDGQDFAAARLAAYKHCAVVLQEQVASALGGLNEQRLGEIGEFLKAGTKLVQRAWSQDEARSPYVELPAAFVHTCCHSADLPLVFRQLDKHLRGPACSPHVAKISSKECGTLHAATRSIVTQFVQPTTTRIASGCAYDFGVLAGWHHDLCKGNVAASARPRFHGGAAPQQSAGGKPEHAPLVVLVRTPSTSMRRS